MEEQGKRSKLSAPTYPTITLPPRPAIDDGLFPTGSGLSPGPMTLVSSFFSDPDSTNRYFSQLLAGAMASSPGAKLPYNPMEVGFEKNHGFKQNKPFNFAVGNSPLFTVPPGLSPSGLLNSPGFFCLSPQSPFGISHQQALAQVTAQAALARAQPEYQTSSAAAPWEQSNSNPQLGIDTEETSEPKPPSVSDHRSSAMEYSGASQFDKRSQPSIAVDKPAEDGYNWRKYGQKHIKGCEYPRSYYKCTYPNCRVRKIVERSAEGEITEIVYKSVHNHKKANGGGDGSVAGNSNNISEIVPAHSIPGNNHEPTPAVELSGLNDGEERCDEENREEGDDNEPDQKRRNTARETAVVLSHKTATDAKLVVQTRSEVDLLVDGYRWRKYGQKVVKGNPHPRSYYKCTSAGCKVRKHVERASSDPKAVITTYEGKHNHDVPAAAKNSNHNAVNDSLPQPKLQHDGVSEKHSLLQEMDYGKNVQEGAAVLRLKEEQVRV